jgi:hypothetical protein
VRLPFGRLLLKLNGQRQQQDKHESTNVKRMYDYPFTKRNVFKIDSLCVSCIKTRTIVLHIGDEANCRGTGLDVRHIRERRRSAQKPKEPSGIKADKIVHVITRLPAKSLHNSLLMCL